MGDLNIEIPAFESPMDMSIGDNSEQLTAHLVTNCINCSKFFNWPEGQERAKCSNCGISLKILTNAEGK